MDTEVLVATTVTVVEPDPGPLVGATWQETGESYVIARDMLWRAVSVVTTFVRLIITPDAAAIFPTTVVSDIQSDASVAEEASRETSLRLATDASTVTLLAAV